MRFRPYELDLRSGELTKFGHKLRLQEQPFQILALLLEHPGEVITREEIQRKLWADDTFVDFEHGLNNAVKRLRETLCDSAEKPRYIETLPRRGYRFIATLECPELQAPRFSVPPSANAGPSRATAPTDSIDAGQISSAETAARTAVAQSLPVPPLRRTGRFWLAVAGASIAALLILWLYLGRQRPFHTNAAVKIQSVAVLPLDNLSGDPSQEYFADGITDALTTYLAQMRGIRVISRTSAMHYKGTKTALPEIAKELGVDAVVTGSALRSNGVIHVNAQLVYAPGDKHIWAHSYEGATSEGATSSLSAIESEIGGDLARTIGTAPPLQSRNYRPRTVSVNPEAYDLYLRSEPYHGFQSRDATDQAIQLLEKSVEIDPQFAAAYAALATAYETRAIGVEVNEPMWIEKANAAVRKALALDPNLAEGYVARGYLLWTRANGWSQERAVSDFRHALELNPNLAEAHHQLANVYNHVGLLDKAEGEIKEAVALDPLNTAARFRVGINLLYQGKYDLSLIELRDSEKFLPTLWAFQTSFALQHIRRQREAQERIDGLLKANPLDVGGSLAAMQALLAAESGDAPFADRKILEAIAKGKGYQHFHHVAYAVASAYALLNRREQAVQYLRIAAEDGFPCYPLFEHDSNLAHLRNDAGFLSFLAEQKKQWEYFREHL